MTTKKALNLSVSGVGVTSCFGNAENTCAAIRAGLNGFYESEMMLPIPGDVEPQNVVTAPISFVAGSESYGRLLALIIPALAEALASANLKLHDLSATDLLLVLPPESSRYALDDIDSFAKEFPQGIEKFIKDGLKRNIHSKLEFRNFTILEGLHSGFADALISAGKYLTQENCDRVAICCVDSLIEEGNIELLMKDNKVKLATNPAGLIPGECAAVAIIENRASNESLGTISTVSIEAGEDNEIDNVLDASLFSTAKLLIGMGQANVFNGPKVDLLIDINGEYERAKYWANNIMQAQNILESSFNVNSTAESLGDIGACTGLLGVIKALHMFSRGYAKNHCILIGTVSDDNNAGIIAVNRD